jgi:tetratricopeptide (TPR) repeat protein
MTSALRTTFRFTSRAVSTLGLLVVIAAVPVAAQLHEVGSLDFPTSATGLAQQRFLRGVALLHSFGWKQARDEFHAAQAIDPDFAMAFWGESLAYNHPLVSQMDPAAPREALARLAATPAQRLAKAPTAREREFLGAVEILWGEGDHVDRRLGYMRAMERLHESYPDDVEVAAFHALSILSAAAALPAGDERERLNVRAGAIALELFGQNPDHPGAPHYVIHAFDDPVHARLALEAAHRFSEIAPAVSHARHMPTHVFIQLGMWSLVSRHNQSAYEAARDLWAPGDDMGDAIHALDWGQYGDLMRGDYRGAATWIRRAELMVAGGFFGRSERGPANTPRAVSTLDLVKARYVVDTEEWRIEAVTRESSANQLLATSLSAYHLGDLETLERAEAELASRRSAGGASAAIVHAQVAALLHASMGHGDVATRFLDDAVAAAERLPPPNGAASPIKPTLELHGELLLEWGRPLEAAEKFEASLALMPNRPRSLLGLGRAALAAGDHARAAKPYETLAELWAGREERPEMLEARRFWREHLAENGPRRQQLTRSLSSM